MDSEQSSGKSGKVKRNSFFSLRKSFSSRGNSLGGDETDNQVDLAADGSPSGASPANRRSSAPAMVTVDENNSEAGTESGTKKKSKMFSTKFVKKMFRSNSMSSATGNEVPFSPEGGESLGGDEEQYDESRMSEVSASVVDGDGSTPKKKKSKIFSTKFVKKMFRSNSLTSNGAPETPASGGPEDLGDPNDTSQNDGEGNSATKPKRKSIFSLGRSSFSGDAKGSAPPSVASPNPERKVPATSPDGAFQGPVSPSFVPPQQQQVANASASNDNDEDEEEEVVRVDTSFKSKQSFFESLSSPAKTPQAGAKSGQSTAMKSPQSQQKAAAVTSPGTAKMLFKAVEEEPATSPAPCAATVVTDTEEQKEQEEKVEAAQSTPFASTPLDSKENKRSSALTPKSQPKSPIRGKSPMAATTSTSPVRTPAAATTPKASLASTTPTPAAKSPLAAPAGAKSPTVARTNTPATRKSEPVPTPVPAPVTPSPPKPVVEAESTPASVPVADDVGQETPPPPPPVTPGSTVGEGSVKAKKSSMFSAAKSITKMLRRASFGVSVSSPAGGDAVPDLAAEAQAAADAAAAAALDDDAVADDAAEQDATEALSEQRSPAASSRAERSLSPGRYAYGSAATAAYPIPTPAFIASPAHHAQEQEDGEGGEVPYEPEPEVFEFVVEYGTGTGEEDPSVLRIHAPGRPEIELADKLVAKSATQPVLTLILRNNAICNPERFCFSQRFERLSELDLAFNNITGTVKGLPATLRKLDLSHNRITNVASILSCAELIDLNLAHNNIKTFYGLPPKLERLDLSHNVVSAIITLRTLALSPGIKQLDLTGNSVVLEVKEWKAIIRNTLTQLVELNGRALPKIKKLGALPPAITGNRTSPPKGRSAAASREEQRVNDAVRTKMYQLKLDMIEESKTTLERNQVVKSKTLRPEEADNLSKRLSVPTKALKHKTSTAPPPPALFSTKDLARRKSLTLSLSSAPAGRAVDVDLTAWLNKSKLQLEKAAKAVTKAVKLANQEHIDSEDVTALTSLLNRLELLSSRDPPLKVESAIAKLTEGDAMKRRAMTVREQMDVLGLLLLQVDSAVLLSAQGVFPLRDALDSALASGPGLVAHTTLLRACDASFDPNLLARKDGNVRTWQNKTALAQQHESSVSYLDDERDDGKYRSNAGSRGGSPSRQSAPLSRRDSGDKDGFAETKSFDVAPKSKDPSLTPEAFMDRVRSRITMRALYGAESIAPVAAAAASPHHSPERRSLDFSASDNRLATASAPVSMPPPLALPAVPTNTDLSARDEAANAASATSTAPPALQSQTSEADLSTMDAKRAAKERVLARMNKTASRSSMSEASESVTPVPPVETTEETTVAPAQEPSSSQLEAAAGVPEELLAPPAPPAATEATSGPVEDIPASTTSSAAAEVASAVYLAEEEEEEEETPTSPFRGYEQNHTWPEESVEDQQYQYQHHYQERELEEVEEQEEFAAVEGQDAYGYDTGYDAGYDTGYGGAYDTEPAAYQEEYAGAYGEEQEGYYGDTYGAETYGDSYDAAPQESWGEDAGVPAAYENESGREEAYDAEPQQYDYSGSGYYEQEADDAVADSTHAAYDDRGASGAAQDSYAYTDADYGAAPSANEHGGYEAAPADSYLAAQEPAAESALSHPVAQVSVASTAADVPVAASVPTDTVPQAAPAIVEQPVIDPVRLSANPSSESVSVSDTSAPAEASAAPSADGDAKLTAKERLLARMAKNKKG